MKKFFMIVLCVVMLAAMALPAFAEEAATTGATEAPALEFNPGRFVEMLPNMGIGMLVIFIIISVIILTTMLINKIFSGKKD